MKYFNLKMRCVVTKSVDCSGPDEATVRANPWDYAISEDEIDQVDWEILSIEENEE